MQNTKLKENFHQLIDEIQDVDTLEMFYFLLRRFQSTWAIFSDDGDLSKEEVWMLDARLETMKQYNSNELRTWSEVKEELEKKYGWKE